MGTSKEGNKAYAEWIKLANKRAVVNMEYYFTDGRKKHTGFSTVEVLRSEDLYDKCYERAETLAEIQGCRLEKFKNASGKFVIYFTNMGFTDDATFDTLDQAKQHAVRKGFEATISSNGRTVGSWSPISGYRDLTE